MGSELKLKNDPIMLIMFFAAGADNKITKDEIERFKQIVTFHGYWKQTSITNDLLASLAKEASDLLSIDGAQHAIKLIINQVDENMKTLALALAIEVCASDFKVVKEEVEFLRGLRKKLNIDVALAKNLEASIKIRYFTNNESKMLKIFR